MLDLLDELGDRGGRSTGLLGKLADLLGDDRESAAVLAGAGSLDRGVEREQVRLVRYAGDRLEDSPDLARLLRELLDPGLGVLPRDSDALHDAVRLTRGRDALLAELLGASGGLRHLVGELAAALEHHRLALGALRDLGARRGDPGHRVRGLVDVVADLRKDLVDAARGVDEQAQRVVHGRLQFGAAIRQVVLCARNADAREVDADARERVEVERVRDRLQVVVEDDPDRALGVGEQLRRRARLGPAEQPAAPGPLVCDPRRGLSQRPSHRVEIGGIPSEVPLERQAHPVVCRSGREKAREVVDAERLRSVGLGEYGPPVSRARRAPFRPQRGDVDAPLRCVLAQEVSRRSALQVVIGQLSRDHIGDLVGPRCELREQREHVRVEADELAPERKVLRRDVVERGQ